ncbi:hypothetical protein D3C81_837170 [compost metagenome]
MPPLGVRSQFDSVPFGDRLSGVISNIIEPESSSVNITFGATDVLKISGCCDTAAWPADSGDSAIAHATMAATPLRNLLPNTVIAVPPTGA